MEFAIGWYIIGFFSSLMAIFVFRRNGTTGKKGELYMAVIGPLFGPIVAVMLLVDFLRRKS